MSFTIKERTTYRPTCQKCGESLWASSTREDAEAKIIEVGDCKTCASIVKRETAEAEARRLKGSAVGMRVSGVNKGPNLHTLYLVNAPGVEYLVQSESQDSLTIGPV